MAPRKSARNAPKVPEPKSSSEDITQENVLAPATHADRQKWKGFCEIESDPALFNFLLHSFGVKGVKVEEIFTLDDEYLDQLPRPIYGLIFLFKWMEQDSDRQEQSCPEEIWFANQTASNSCASVALLNIVNNVPELDLGDNLAGFRSFTESFSPALRGDAIDNFTFVKSIHNSFTRKMDMLNCDLFLKEQAEAKGKGKKGKENDDEIETGFHFIAFMPIGGNLWKMDGLERQPICLQTVGGDWIKQVTPDLQARMAQYTEDQIEFAILSLVKDPLPTLIDNLAANIKSLQVIMKRIIDLRVEAGSAYSSSDESETEPTVLYRPEPRHGVTQEVLDSAEVTDTAKKFLESASLEELRKYRRELEKEKRELKAAVQDQQQTKQGYEEKASSRRRDIGDKMQKFAAKVKQKYLQQAHE